MSRSQFPDPRTIGRVYRRQANRYLLPFAVLFLSSISSAHGHDPSAWGGLFRSRDYGATWMSANRGHFLSGALTLAVSPTDANHLLLGTENGLLRSRNGGRDWKIEASSVMLGSVFAAAFASDGRQTLVSTALGIFYAENDNDWRSLSTLQDAAPARAIHSKRDGLAFYVAGRTGLYRSDDRGVLWSSIAGDFAREAVTSLLAVRGRPETLYVIVRGQLWASADGGRTWARRGNGVFSANLDVLAEDLRQPARLWAAGADGLFWSDDAGVSWRRVGPPFPEPNTVVHGIAASEESIVLATDRGLNWRVDGVAGWNLINDNLPAHLEAGPLVRDPTDPATLYAGFSLIPYAELWRRAVDRENGFARVSITSLVGSMVLLTLTTLGALAALRSLGRYYPKNARPMQRTRDVGVRGKTLP